MKQFFLAGALAFASSTALSATDQVPVDRNISQISVYESEALIYFSPAFANSQSCEGNDQNIAVIDLANEKGKAMLSTALAAAAAKQKIGLGLNGCKSYPLIYRLDTKY